TMRKLLILPLLSLVAVTGCVDGVGPTTGIPQIGTFATSDVTLSAGMENLQPEPADTLSGSVDATRFDVAQFQRVYELETPAGADFSFNIMARGWGNFGLTQLSLGHVADNNLAPAHGMESLVGTGMTIEAPGLSNQGNTVDINGDGFARATVRGNISTEQVLL